MGAAATKTPASLVDLDYLTPDEQDEYSKLLELQVGGEGLVEFINRVWPDEPVPRHLLPVAEAIERARVMPIKICISMPPGGAKTTFLIRAIAWWLTRSPADLCAYTSFSSTQAREKSGLARDGAIRSGVDVVRDSASHWTTNFGGGVVATGPGGLTGKRVPGLLIYDDPYKDASEAASERRNTLIWSRFKQVSRTRVQGGSIIVMHTRWDDDDLIGKCVSQLGWEVINITAIAEAVNDNAEAGEIVPPDILGRAPGESFWPERYPVERCQGQCGHDGHLDEIRHELGDWTWAAMYQGRTRPLAGGMFKREFFRVVDAAPPGGAVARAWDLASSTGAQAAYTVGIKGRLVDGRIYIEHVTRDRIDGGDVLDHIVEVARADGADVEVDVPKDPGQASDGQVKHIGRALPAHVVWWSPERGSKPIRARPLASFAKAGGIVLVAGPWLQVLLAELCSFPTGTFKDQVDALVRLHARLLQMAEAFDGPGGGSVSIKRSA